MFLFATCKKETIRLLDFNSITVTDSLCQVVGNTAPGNWTNDNDWVTAEHNLLAFKRMAGSVDSALSKLTVLPACRNPNDGRFLLRVKSTKVCKMNWVIVNRNLEILQYAKRIVDSGQIVIPFDFRGNTVFDTATNYRLYYGFYNATDSLYYKGHGNIRWQ